MFEMMFSFVIAVYNVAPYLRECLDSVLAAAKTLNEKCGLSNEKCGSGVEIICVDDGSTDGSGAILDEYATMDWRFIVIHQKNSGVSAARNCGFEASHGEWVLFMDSDDVIVPNALVKVADAIARNDCEMVTFEMCRVKNVHEEIPKSIGEYETLIDMNNADEAVRFIRKNFPHCLWAWNKCIKRSLIGAQRFENYQPCEDAVFILSCITRANRIAELPDVLYKYLQHEGSCLSHVSPKRVNGDINGMQRLTEVMCEWQFFHEAKSFVQHVMRYQFLVNITRDFQQLRGEQVMLSDLEASYARSVQGVFCGLPLFGMFRRCLYRLVFGRCSVDEVSKGLVHLCSIASVANLPRRVAGRIKRLLVG